LKSRAPFIQLVAGVGGRCPANIQDFGNQVGKRSR
jgi:hypothetical protein